MGEWVSNRFLVILTQQPISLRGENDTIIGEASAVETGDEITESGKWLLLDTHSTDGENTRMQ